jgi:hypothetical protein
MPFTRPHLTQVYSKMFSPWKIRWHVLAEKPVDGLPEFAELMIVPPGIPESLGPGQTGGWVCYEKINQWLEKYSAELDPDSWIHFCADDNGIPPGFYVKALQGIDPKTEVVMTSTLRGYHTPVGIGTGHATTTLFAEPANMVRGRVDMVQLLVRSRIASRIRFQHLREADGELIERLTTQYPCEYRRAVYSEFNKFEPGRWSTR